MPFLIHTKSSGNAIPHIQKAPAEGDGKTNSMPCCAPSGAWPDKPLPRDMKVFATSTENDVLPMRMFFTGSGRATCAYVHTAPLNKIMPREMPNIDAVFIIYSMMQVDIYYKPCYHIYSSSFCWKSKNLGKGVRHARVNPQTWRSGESWRYHVLHSRNQRECGTPWNRSPSGSFHSPW